MLIDLKRDVETISWSDEPGAKEYTIDFSDGGLERMRKAMEQLKGSLPGMSKESDEAASAIKDFVVSVAGEDCYDDALAYVDATGAGAEGCTIAMLSLVTALADVVCDRLGIEKEKRARYYTGKDDGLGLV